MPRAVETVGEIAATHPSAIRVFERFGIDYCCGGQKPLGVACAELDLEVGLVLEALAVEAASEPEAETDWSRLPLRILCDHIVSRHHSFLRKELPRLASLAEKVAGKHSEHHPELRDIRTTFDQLNSELIEHLAKEERVLFPYVSLLEASISGEGNKPASWFGSVTGPIGAMTEEHEDAGQALAELRRLSRDYTAPEDACASFRAFYDGLRALEQDLHQHIHLENNVLFPRTVALEEEAPESRKG